jgi:type I restriction enzyme S subunit
MSRSDWKTVRLGEIGKVSMCRRIFAHETSETGDIPFYKISTFGDVPKSYISQDKYNEYKNRYPYPKIGDVLLSAAGTIGRTVIFDGQPSYFQDSNIVWLAHDKTKVLNRYLYYFYQTHNWITDGSTISRIYNSTIEKSEIPLPPLPTQQRIAEVLGALDDKIELNRKQNKTLEALAQTLFKHYFLDNPERESWEIGKLGDMILENPKSKVMVNQAMSSGGEYQFYTSGKKILTLNQFMVDGFNILLNTGGIADVKMGLGKIAYSTDTWCIKGSIDNQTFFLYCYFVNMGDILNENYFEGSALKHLQKRALKACVTRIPPDFLLTEFNNIVTPLFEQIALNTSEIRKLKKIRDYLLPRLISGKLDVSEVVL